MFKGRDHKPFSEPEKRRFSAFVLLLTLALLLPHFLYAQASALRLYRDQSILGFSLGASQTTTKWKLKSGAQPDPELAAPPVHIHKMLAFSVFSEKRTVKSFGAMDLDWRNELSFKLFGQTEQDYLADSMPAIVSKGSVGGNPIYSPGGLGFTLATFFRFAWPKHISHKSIIAPFLGPGIEFFYLGARGMGEDLDEQYRETVYANRSYKIGWSEYGISAPLELGMHFMFNTFTITPEVRYRPIGFALSNLKGAPEIEYNGINSLSVQLSFGVTRMNSF